MTEPNLAPTLAARQAGALPDELGISWDHVGPGRSVGRFTVAGKHMAPNGFVHAAAVIALADTACGFGCIASLPEGATSFTTLELKSNFLSSGAIGDVVETEARLAHGGRTTQVWDAQVRNLSSGKAMALFRCTQMILYPR
jgi:1,4-dihydroxy-2-naphthoyl-CoA hydrolase